MKRLGLVLFLGVVAIGGAVVAAAQLKVDVGLVNVVATVTDDQGRYVSDLSPDDLVVEEDGQVQKIAHFDQSEDLPVSVGILLDTSGSMERKIATATRSVERFIRRIHQDDDIFLMTFSNRPSVRQDFTSDREKLAVALRRVVVSGGTALYDALDEGLGKIRHGKHDKRAILLITDGEDTSSDITFDQATLAVRESELLVYCLGISPASGFLSEERPRIGPPVRRGPSTGGRRPTDPTNPFPFPGIPRIPGIPRFPLSGTSMPPLSQFPQGSGGSSGSVDTVDMSVLNTFADASGGKAWLLSGNWSDKRGNQVDNALDEIASELRNQYSIGYYPSHSLQDGKWHRIEIHATNPRYHVRARKEYFGK